MSGNASKIHDNREVKAFLAPVSTLSDACRDRPWLEDLLTGAVHLKSPKDTATRPLSRSVVLHVLGQCDDITVQSVLEVSGNRYSNSQASKYAACARVVSKAIEARLRTQLQTQEQVADFNFSPIEREPCEALMATSRALPVGLIP